MRVATWNIQNLHPYQEGTVAHTEFAKALAELAPDVLLLQEVDRQRERSGNIDQTSLAAQLLDTIHYWFAATPRDPGDYGIALISRLRVSGWHELRLPPSPIGKRLTFNFEGTPETFYCRDHERAALAAQLESGWLVVNLHASFVPLASHLMVWRTARWAKRLARHHQLKLLIGGDFNLEATGWLRLLGLKSLFTANTFPMDHPNRQIDFLCVPTAQATDVRDFQVRRYGISDHLAIVLELS